MKRYNVFIALLALAIAPVLSTFAQSRALPILEVTPGARNIAMGSNTVGVSKGFYVYTNPTSIFGEGAKAVNLSYSGQLYSKLEGAGNLQYHALGGAYKMGRHAFLAGFRYMGGHKLTTDTEGTLSPKSWTADLKYAMNIGWGLSASIGGSLIQSTFMTTATAGAFNASLHYTDDFNLSGMTVDYTLGGSVAGLGFALDYGKDTKKVDMPAHSDFGGEMGFNFSADHKLSVALNGQAYFLPMDAQSFSAGGGLEYGFRQMIFIRGGYVQGQNDYKMASFGLGGAFGGFTVDAAYQKSIAKYGVDALTVSLGYSF